MSHFHWLYDFSMRRPLNLGISPEKTSNFGGSFHDSAIVLAPVSGVFFAEVISFWSQCQGHSSKRHEEIP